MLCRLTIITEKHYCFRVVITSSLKISAQCTGKKNPDKLSASKYRERNREEGAALWHSVSKPSAAPCPQPHAGDMQRDICPATPGEREGGSWS